MWAQLIIIGVVFWSKIITGHIGGPNPHKRIGLGSDQNNSDPIV